MTTPLYDFSEVKFTADHFFYLRLFYGNEYFGSEQRILFDVGPKQNETKKKWSGNNETLFSNHRSHALMYWPNIHGLDGMGQIKWASTFGMYADSWCEMMVIWSIITTRKFPQIAIEDLFFFSFPLFRCWSFLLLFVLFYLFCRWFEICHEFFLSAKFDCWVDCFWWELKTKVFFNFCLTFVALELNCIIVAA